MPSEKRHKKSKVEKALSKNSAFKRREKRLNRSVAGNSMLFALMIICGIFMVLPLVMIVNNALKPLDELYQYPIFRKNPASKTLRIISPYE